MKKSYVWIIVAIFLVGLLFGAASLYNKYSDEYFNQETEQQSNNISIETTENNINENLAPDFTVTDMNGNKVNLSDYKGKPVVLNFWATWCYYCKVEMPDFNEAYKENPDVQFLMVNATDGHRETVDGAKSFIDEEQYDFDVFFDTENRNAVKNYNITSYPQTFFIDKDGNIVKHWSGMISKDMLQQEIEKIK